MFYARYKCQYKDKTGSEESQKCVVYDYLCVRLLCVVMCTCVPAHTYFCAFVLLAHQYIGCSGRAGEWVDLRRFLVLVAAQHAGALIGAWGWAGRFWSRKNREK